MVLKTLLEERLSHAMEELGIPKDCTPMVAVSARVQNGDYQANGAMAAAKRAGLNPRELAHRILEKVDLDGIVESIEVAGPGFINLRICAKFLGTALSNSTPENSSTRAVQTVVIDYSGPNLAKEMHVGHLRSTIIGDCIARVLEYRGERVIRQNHVGDWGTQFGMLIAELELHLGKGEPANLALDDLEKFYQQAKRHFDEDPQFAEHARAYVVRLQSGDDHCRSLWRQFITISIKHNLDIYQRLNVGLSEEHIKAESAYNEQLAGLLQRLTDQQIAVDDQGAKVIYLDELADKKGRPSAMIVRKSDGGFLYSTTDLAALEYRAQTLNAHRVLYFIDARQSLHMQQVFCAGRRAELVTSGVKLEHHAFGTMMGKDGKPFKTRSGGTVKLADLITESAERAAQLVQSKNPDLNDEDIATIARKVGIGAIKYADLSKTRTQDYVFDWDEMLSFEGNTGPYLQYAVTRVGSLFKRAGLDMRTFAAPARIDQPEERALALALLQFDDVIEQVASECYPHVLCSYLYGLTSAFMTFYEACPVLKKETPSAIQDSRLQLCKLTAEKMSCGLDLLGIEVMPTM